MPYDLPIVRTKNWMDAPGAPITKQEVDSLIAADRELAWSTKDFVEMRDTEGNVERSWFITWAGRSCFWWYQGQIQCSNPTKAQVLKLVQMSRALKAHVVGDDGEIYPLQPDGSMSGTRQGFKTPFQWPLWKQLVAAFLIGCILLAFKVLIFGD